MMGSISDMLEGDGRSRHDSMSLCVELRGPLQR